MRLTDIDPTRLADAALEAALGRLWRLAEACGVTDTVEPSVRPSRLWLAVHQLATYATTGAAPEGRPELIYEYQLSVAEYAALLPTGETRDGLETALQAAAVRERLDRGIEVSQAQLAALAGMSDRHYRRLVEAGDAPGGEGRGRAGAQIPATAARTWLSGRGVQGL